MPRTHRNRSRRRASARFEPLECRRLLASDLAAGLGSLLSAPTLLGPPQVGSAAAASEVSDDTSFVFGDVYHDLNRNGRRDAAPVIAEGAQVLFVLDRSGSMDDPFGPLVNGQRLSRLDVLKQAVLDFADEVRAAGLGDSVQVGVLLFAGLREDGVSGLQNLDLDPSQDGVQAFTTLDAEGAARLGEAVNAIEVSRTGTQYLPALDAALATFEAAQLDNQGPRTLILLSDGLPDEDREDGPDTGSEFNNAYRAEREELLRADVLPIAFGLSRASAGALGYLQLIDPGAQTLLQPDDVADAFLEIATGTREFLEPGVPNTPVFLDANGNGTLDTNEHATNTDAEGRYVLAGVAGAAQTVVAVAPSGWGFTEPTSGAATIPASDPGEATQQDFGVVELLAGSINGRVYADADRDSVFTPGQDQPIGGVTIFVFDDTGAEAAAAVVTDADGRYEFTGLLPGVYRLVQEESDSLIDLGAASATPGAVAGINQISNILVPDSIQAAGVAPGNDFLEAIPQATAIAGVVYDDADGDGVRDPGEPSIPGEVVYLDLDRDGLRGPIEPFAETDSTGAFRIPNVDPDEYLVRFETTQLRGPSDSGATEVIVMGLDDTIGLEFPTVALVGDITGRVYVDADRDNVFQPDADEGVAGVTITARRADGIEAAVTTAADGTYAFVGLEAGTYTLVQTQPDDLVDLDESTETPGAVVNETDNEISNVTVVAGVVAVGNDFTEGRRGPTAIRGTVYDDLNRNGVRDGDQRIGSGTQVVFVVDTSGSMNWDFDGETISDPRDSRLAAVSLALTSLVDGLADAGIGDSVQLGVVTFNDAAAVVDLGPVSQGVQSFVPPSRDEDAMGGSDFVEATELDELREVRSRGTNFSVGLQLAIDLFEESPVDAASRLIVFLSDGDNGGPLTAQAEAIRDAGIDARAFGVGAGALDQFRELDPNAELLSTSEQLVDAISALIDPGDSEFLEPPLEGRRVYADLDDNGRHDPGEPETRSAAAGSYEIVGLAPGMYTIRVEPFALREVTGPADAVYTVELIGLDDAVGRDFGTAPGEASEEVPIAAPPPIVPPTVIPPRIDLPVAITLPSEAPRVAVQASATESPGFTGSSDMGPSASDSSSGYGVTEVQSPQQRFGRGVDEIDYDLLFEALIDFQRPDLLPIDLGDETPDEATEEAPEPTSGSAATSGGEEAVQVSSNANPSIPALEARDAALASAGDAVAVEASLLEDATLETTLEGDTSASASRWAVTSAVGGVVAAGAVVRRRSPSRTEHESRGGSGR